MPSRLVSPWVFLPISTHFTTTPAIPPTSASLQPRRMGWRLAVKRPDFTPHARGRLRALYAQSIRTTLGSSLFPRYRHHRPPKKEFTTRRPSSSTRRCSFRLAPIDENSLLLPPVGVWAVS